jgi:PAS domain S-box-containing protein
MSGSDPMADPGKPTTTSDPFTGDGATMPDSKSFRAIADTAPVAIWITNADGACIYLNRAWCEFTGQQEADGLGVGWLECLHADDRPKARDALTLARSRRDGFRAEYRLRRHDGAYRWTIDAGKPRFDESGRFLGYIGSVIDITDQKVAQETLRRLNMTLEEQVRDEAAERQKAEIALAQAQKMDALGQLTGGVAHDFNNILAAIVSGIELARRRVSDPAVTRMLGLVLGAADRGAKLTEQLLAFSRKQALNKKPHDVNTLITNFGDLLVRTLGPSIKLDFQLAQGCPAVMADAPQLETAILNLAINSRDAMPDGGTLTIETRVLPFGSPEIPPHVPRSEYVRLRISDTGKGMDADVASRAFEPFFTTKEVGRGTGLGLSQVWGFAKQHGGSVQIDSEVDRGTTVTVFLPATSETADTTARPDTHPEPVAEPTRSLHILLVDDDDDVREVTAEMLSGLGLKVTAAASPMLGLEIVRSGAKIDLVLVDYAMPGMNGIEFVKRARIGRPNLPFLLVSGYASVIEKYGLETAGLPMLKKPYRAADLAAVIQRTLGTADPGAERRDH